MNRDIWHIPENPDSDKPSSSSWERLFWGEGLREGEYLIGNRFFIQKELGRGGAGMVFQAMDRVQGITLAIKILHPGLACIPSIGTTFQNEARISMKLRHPNILRVLDVLEMDQLKCLTMELLDGRNLRETIKEEPTRFRDEIEATELIVVPLVEALVYAHYYTIHRDIKPENIGVEQSGKVKLMDFGIARIQGQHTTTIQHSALTQLNAGTPYYTAPEQVHDSQTADHRGDQYSLGIVIYELLTGSIPVGVLPPLELARPDLPLKLTRCIDRALAARPECRFPDMAAFGESFCAGMKRARSPVLKRFDNRRSHQAVKTGIPILVALLLLLFAAKNYRDGVRDKTAQLEASWQRLQTVAWEMDNLESDLEESEGIHRLDKQNLENALNRAELGLIENWQWLNPSNAAWKSSQLQTYYETNPIRQTLARSDYDLKQVRRFLLNGSVEEVDRMFNKIKTELERVRNQIQSAPSLLERHTRMVKLLEGLDHLHRIGRIDNLEYESIRRSSEPIEPNLDWFESILQKHWNRLESEVERSKEAWTDYYPNLDLEALAFIRDIPTLLAESEVYRELGDFAHGIDRLIQARETLDQWTIDIKQCLENSDPSWVRAEDKMENTIGMRFIRVGKGYLSIWETRVVDYARFIWEHPMAKLSFDRFWTNPGFPISPGSPVVGILPAEADVFAGWLSNTFPNKQTEGGLPNHMTPHESIYYSELASLYGNKMALYANQNEWNEGFFAENYADTTWDPTQWIRNVGMGEPDSKGFFNLHDNVWEWTVDRYYFKSDGPSNHSVYPILRGGSHGTTTYHNHEPPLEGMEYLTRKEMIGFRVYISAFPKKDQFR